MRSRTFCTARQDPQRRSKLEWQYQATTTTPGIITAGIVVVAFPWSGTRPGQGIRAGRRCAGRSGCPGDPKCIRRRCRRRRRGLAGGICADGFPSGVDQSPAGAALCQQRYPASRTVHPTLLPSVRIPSAGRRRRHAPGPSGQTCQSYECEPILTAFKTPRRKSVGAFD